MKKTLVILAGPTAVGKTGCGIRIARQLGTEIISADSRQIYHETTIGTAVPSQDELALVPHHFIQTNSVKESYNASIYEHEVMDRLTLLFGKCDKVLMVGGSGLYIDAVSNGIDDFPSTDPDLRIFLRKRFEEEGLEPMIQELLKIDPMSYNRVDLKNPMRVLKALEVSFQTGTPYSSFLSDTPKKRPFNILRIGLDMERAMLYDRINQRVLKMMESGLLDEVEHLADLRGYSAMKTLGYRELFTYIDGEIALDEAVDMIKRNTRKFARKQLTWFRKENLYSWFLPDDTDGILHWIDKNSI